MKRVVYLGFNDPRIHARGVEYVILTQSTATGVQRGYYLFWGPTNDVFRWHGLICISIKKNAHWPLRMNAVLRNLRHRFPGILIHGHNYLMAVVSVYRMDVFTVHDGLRYLKTSTGSASRIWAMIENRVYRRTNFIHFISNFARSQTTDGYLTRDHRIIYNTSPREILSTSKPVDRAGRDSGQSFALMVRSIEARVGFDLVLDLARSLELQDIPLRIIVAGKGPLLGHYTDLVRERRLSNIEFLGYVADEKLAQLYQTCEFTITPALHGEGFGLPVIESYFFGKPALASDVCALPEVVRETSDLFANDLQSLLNKVLAQLSPTTVEPPETYSSYYEANFGQAVYAEKMGRMYADAAIQRTPGIGP